MELRERVRGTGKIKAQSASHAGISHARINFGSADKFSAKFRSTTTLVLCQTTSLGKDEARSITNDWGMHSFENVLHKLGINDHLTHDSRELVKPEQSLESGFD